MSAPLCLHCSTPLPPSLGGERFCCRGCAAVHDLLLAQGLTRYYDLAGAGVLPASLAADPPAGHAWLEPLMAVARTGRGGTALRLDVQGIHCSACVWLFQETFRRRAGAGAITVNPALGQVALAFDRDRFEVEGWIREIERFGYRFGPARKSASKRSRELPLRLGISAALSVNTMLFSVSFYFGLAPGEPELFRLFSWLALALSTAVVVVGGWPFFRSALLALKRGVLHLDLPIALGIALVYLTSLARMRGGRGDLAYFDTLDVFITLMLAGRLLQERLVERNRKLLLEDGGVAGLVARRIEGERLNVVPVARLALGDRLVISPGDLVPVDASLASASATVSTDWIDGESEPRSIARGGRIAAGSFNAGTLAFEAEAATAFADSRLVDLLRPAASTRSEGEPSVGPHGRLWDRLARVWVASVGASALAGLALWWPVDPERALAVAAAVLVVTCPCAIGIAIPLAHELTFQRLRRAGCFVRSGDLVDRLVRVKKLLFDKTGTLTLGRLELARPEQMRALPESVRRIAFNLAARSSHPVARALVDALEPLAIAFEPGAEVSELAGRGLEWQRADGLWRLGRAEWAAPGFQIANPRGGTVLARNGVALALLELRERLRPDAKVELARLAAAGHEIWLISGDGAAKVSALAAELGIPPERALSAQSPEQKAALVARLDRSDTLFLGDGVNDALAFAAAYTAGTPAIDRAVMPGRSDFFLVGDGLAPLAEALDAAHRLRRLVRRLLAFGALYNLAAVASALAGFVSPLVAAVVMPASTLALVALTLASLEPRRSAARTQLAPASPRVTPQKLAEAGA